MHRITATVCAAALAFVGLASPATMATPDPTRPAPPQDIPDTRDIVDPTSPGKEGYFLTASDEFGGADVNRALFTDRYLPHWTTGELDRATYEVRDGVLRLVVDKDKPAWDPVHDGATQVSGLSTYSRDWLHNWAGTRQLARHFDSFRGFQQRYGYAEARIKAHAGNCTHVAFWALGNQSDAAEGERPAYNFLRPGHALDSGEIDITETLGKTPDGVPQIAVHPWGDASLRSKRAFVGTPGTSYTEQFHTYAMAWDEHKVTLSVDGKEVATTSRAPHYPLFFILNAYAKPAGGWTCDNSQPKDPNYPVTMEVDWFRVYQKLPGDRQVSHVGDAFLRGTAVRVAGNRMPGMLLQGDRKEGVVRFLGNGETNDATFTSIHAPRDGRYRATLKYSSAEDRDVLVQVGDGTPTRLAKLNSGSWRWRDAKTVDIELDLKEGPNRVRFFNPTAPAPDLGAFTVEMSPLASEHSRGSTSPSGGR